MSDQPPLPPNLRPDAFAGVADDYVRYRLPYPAAMVAAILGEVDIPASGARAIDLACGTGRVGLAIASRFDEVLAVDLEPEMVEAGRREARRQGASHIRWRVGRAEDFDAPAGMFHLVTVGEAFHRLDRARVAALAFGWLAPGGAFVTMGSANYLDGDVPWRRVVADVVRQFVGEPARRLGARNAPITDEIADEAAVLRGAGFHPLVTRDFGVAHEWSLPELLGNLRSMSSLSRAALGAQHKTFEATLSDVLLAHDPSGRYPERVWFGYTLARKPG